MFEMATRLMLKEENSERARTGSGVYTGEELWLRAGAALAALLISDIEAISLADQEGTETIPSYRTLPFFEPSKTIAVLGRRVFAVGPVPETVDYVHRTTAEYLGAAWLAQAVRAGLPIGRVIALMGVDGHPAPELRGLPFAVAQWRQISGEMRQPGLDPGVDPRFHLFAQRPIGREGTK
jgi:hypothetical protein